MSDETGLTMLGWALFGVGIETPLFLKRRIRFCWLSYVGYTRSFDQQKTGIGRLRKKLGNRKQRRRGPR